MTAAETVHLTPEDIQQLVKEPSANMRSRIAEKVAAGYNSGLFNETEHLLALEIFRLLLRDTEVRVRRAVAESLKHSLSVPHDIIFHLANDVPDVATHVLQHSFVLTEEDLIAIVQATREVPKLKAIAKRESLSKSLTHALVETRAPAVLKEVVSNRNAALAETTLEMILEEFSREHDVLEELVYRGGLPYAFAEKLFSKVSDNLKKTLTRRYRLSLHVVEEATEMARETATLQFLAPWMSQQEISRLVDQMYRGKRLTHSIVLRSLCIGDLRFFETALAKLVGIPVANARILIIDPGPLGFKALYDSAQLPEAFYPAVKLMLRLALEETQYGTYRATNFGQRMVERIASGGFDKSVEHMDTLMSMIGRGMSDRATLH
ncbi:MAG: DUF2336 domain-containing protein [Rickettsiales bacterium]|nr:DUF2336 domain-containing protein [Rickettsiales bacterium]